MSGFFMIRREAFEASLRQLSLQGYKLLVDIIASAPEPLRIKEFPSVFRMRQRGESKLDALVSLEYLMLLLDKMFGRWIQARFILFMAIGGLGVFVHMGILAFPAESRGRIICCWAEHRDCVCDDIQLFPKQYIYLPG